LSLFPQRAGWLYVFRLAQVDDRRHRIEPNNNETRPADERIRLGTDWATESFNSVSVDNLTT